MSQPPSRRRAPAAPALQRALPALPMLALALLGLAGPASAQAPDANLARNLAATCANCHGTNGTARGDMKTLAGVSAEKIVAMLNDFKAGNQPATIMHQIAKGYTDAQIAAIAGYFAAQKPAGK